MNELFLRLLANKGWLAREWGSGDKTYTDYAKAFPVGYNGKINDIPVAVIFSYLDKDNVPGMARFYFVTEGRIRPNKANRGVILKGRDRIICTFDQAGYMTALKYMMFANPISSYSQDGKSILYNHNAI